MSKPKIRFEGFADDWEQRKLGEVAKYRNGKAHENCIDDDGKYIVVNSKFVSTNGKVKKFSNMQNEPLFENEIAFVLSDVPNGRAIARTFLVEKSDKYTLNQRIAGITPLSETDSYYLYALMNRHPYFLAFDDGVKQTNLSVSDVMKFESYYPKYEEQETIGRYFSQLENLITLHQWKYYFCEKNRINVWEQRKLGKEATEMVAGGDIDKNIILDKGNYPVIANALTNDGIVGYYDHEYRVKAPAVTVTGRGDVGHAKARNIDFTPVVRLLSLKTNHDVLFLENAINTLKIVVESTGVPQLTVPQLAKYEVYFPKKIEEEKKIGRYFKHLDHLITLHQWKCNAYEKDRVIAEKQRKLEIILINLQKYTFLRVILVYKQWIIICIYYENILLRFYVVINVKVIFLFIIIFENIAIIYKLSCVFTIYYSHLFLFMYEINIIVMRVLILQNILFRKFTMNQVVIIKYLFTCAWFIIYYSKKHLKIIFAFVEIIILVTKER